MNKMILDIRYFGLGDSLVFSTIPERCAEKGIDFYLSESSRQHFTPSGNPQVFDIVWKSNPYFKGFSDGKITGGNMYKSKESVTESIVYQMERLHGFSPVNKYPKIYIELEKIPELENVTLVDVNCFAIYEEMWRNRDLLVSKIDELIGNDKDVYYVDLKNKPDKINDINPVLLKRFKPFPIDSLLYYCHVLNSVKRFVTVLSGANTLASAIKKDTGTLQIDTVIWHWLQGTYYFDNINNHIIHTK